MIRPLRYLVGYCVVSVPVDKSAAFAELCRKGGIPCSYLGQLKDDTGERRRFTCSMGVCARLCRICPRMDIELRVDDRRGLPILLGEVARRPGIWLALLLFGAMALASSGAVWDIRVEGNARLSDAQVKETLKDSGLSVGARKRSLDIDRIENRALILSDDISWISVNIFGTVAEVEIRETAPTENGEDYLASNLVAKKNGVIVELCEVRGNIAVELGEEVSEGQLLVGGIYGSDTEPLRLVRARGSVIALCRREYEIKIPMEFDKKAYTGEQKIKKSVIFFEKEVKFFGNSGNSYASCDTIDREEYLYFFGVRLPVAVRTVTCSEFETRRAVMTEEQAREQAIYTLWQRLYEEAPDAQVVAKSLTGRVENGSYILTASIDTHEDIAEERKIEVDIFGAGKP